MCTCTWWICTATRCVLCVCVVCGCVLYVGVWACECVIVSMWMCVLYMCVCVCGWVGGWVCECLCVCVCVCVVCVCVCMCSVCWVWVGVNTCMYESSWDLRCSHLYLCNMVQLPAGSICMLNLLRTCMHVWHQIYLSIIAVIRTPLAGDLITVNCKYVNVMCNTLLLHMYLMQVILWWAWGWNYSTIHDSIKGMSVSWLLHKVVEISMWQLLYANATVVGYTVYRTAENFGGRKHWRIWRIAR